MDFHGFKNIIIGSGFWGATLAERLAEEKGESVLVLELRDHPGGNSYSYFDQNTNIEVHKYGSHIFHTKEQEVWDYITRFCDFNNYRHKVLIEHKNSIYSMPINLSTINQFYGENFTPKEAEAFLKEEALKANIKDPKNFEEVIVSQIGYPMYEAFIKGYSEKQWARDPKTLPSYIIKRLPVRFDDNQYYFDDPYQGIPEKGYGDVFEKMLEHENIEVRYNIDYFEVRDQLPEESRLFYSGPIDKFFDYQYGELNWRSLEFEEERVKTNDYQGTTVVNYGDLDNPYTRSHEFRHYHPEIDYSNLEETIVFHETSISTKKGEMPYYPIGMQEDKEKFAKYLELSKKLGNVYLGGRLGGYTYLNMDQVIFKALDLFNTL